MLVVRQDLSDTALSPLLCAFPTTRYCISLNSNFNTIGNVITDPTTGELTIDTVAPEAPTVDAQVTNDTSPILTGTYDPSDAPVALTVEVDGVVYVLGVDPALTVDDTAGTWALDLVDAGVVLADGPYDVVVTQIDGAGNSASDPTVDELVIDTVAPTAPTVVAQTNTDGLPVIQGTWNPTVSVDLSVTVDGDTFVLGLDPELTVNGASWALDLSGEPAALPSGTYDVDAVAGDEAGNTSPDLTAGELVVFLDPDAEHQHDEERRDEGDAPGEVAADQRPRGRARAARHHAALRRLGDPELTDAAITAWLDRLFSRNGWLDLGRKKPIPHESWFAVAGYFFFYGHFYAAECIEALPETDRPPLQDRLARIMMPLQEPDGCFWDYPFYDYHTQYGTAFAVRTLVRCRHQ
jgi:hypothetical protein